MQGRGFFFQTSDYLSYFPSMITMIIIPSKEGAGLHFHLPKSTRELYLSKGHVQMSPELTLALKLLFPQYLQNLGVLDVTTESCSKPHVFHSFSSSTQGGREAPFLPGGGSLQA